MNSPIFTVRQRRCVFVNLNVAAFTRIHICILLDSHLSPCQVNV